MRHRAVLVLLFAISTAVSGSTQQRSAPTVLQGAISGSGGQLVGTWRLISRVVRLEDGTAVQEGLGTTPKGYLIYDSSGHMAVQLLRPDVQEHKTVGESLPFSKSETKSRVESSSRAQFR